MRGSLSHTLSSRRRAAGRARPPHTLSNVKEPSLKRILTSPTNLSKAMAGARDEAVSVTFTETGSLGLRLIWEPSSSRLTLKGVHEGTQAERHPQLRRHLAQGLLLRSVGGEDVVGKSYEESIASLKASSRPLTVTFDLVGPEDDEGAG